MASQRQVRREKAKTDERARLEKRIVATTEKERNVGVYVFVSKVCGVSMS
jgi:hypothetical protein